VTAGRARDPLKSYRSKRDFALTTEPPPGASVEVRRGKAAAPRFVIHEHAARRMHWDLRLERDGVLACWALPKGMPMEPGVNHLAPRTEAHPVSYLHFEGEIPAGSYGAGTMRVWDHGTYECLKWEPRKIEVALHGERLQARYALFAIGEEGESRNWMIHRMDAAAEGHREPMPERVAPMLAGAGELPREDERWGFEIKWDGVRAIAFGEPGRVRFQSRSLHDITASYPELAGLARGLRSHRAVLDGEIVAFDAQGRPSFEALGRRMHVASATRAKRLATEVPTTYVIFDLLWLDGRSMLADPYRERRRALADLGLNGERWQTPDHIVGKGRRTLEASAAAGLEGIVAKRLDAPYEPGRRSGAWIKLKNLNRAQVVIGGWTPGTGRQSDGIGALLVGEHDAGGALRYLGRVGSGLGESERDHLAGALAALARADSPFSPDGPQPPRLARFCEPILHARVAFSERTRAGLLRQPVFEALAGADDHASAAPGATAELIVQAAGGRRSRARVGGRELTLSNLDKVLYPASGFAKRDVIDYYAQIAPALLGHLRDRPLTVVRYPDGVEGKAFFQKQAPAHRPEWVSTFAVDGGRSGRIDYTLAQDAPTLIWLANLAALELHVPLSRAPTLERPEAVVFDLDPGAPATVVECCRVALWLHGTFERLGLASFVKTSGSKGLQVYLPVGGRVSFEQTKSFAREVAMLVERAEPELALSRMTRTLRAGKVFIDWSQNDEHKTTVCAYSLRAREEPTVSTPLEWEEVRAALRAPGESPLSFDAAAVLARVRERGDLFAPMLSLAQTLPAL
jgi:bifunctional non-homologous end joining protein LigD